MKIQKWIRLMAGFAALVFLFITPPAGAVLAMAISSGVEMGLESGLHVQDQEAENSAAALDALGLFSGTGQGYALYRIATRAEGATMLVRLLGREMESKASTYAHPFKDVPSWADASIGLLYRIGLTKGVSQNRFAPGEPLTGRQYLAFVLRSLGYAEETDSTYQKAVPLSVELGLLRQNDSVALFPDNPLRRADMVKLSERALTVPRRKTNRRLLDSLVIAGQVQPEPAGVWMAAHLSPRILQGESDPYRQSLRFHDWLVNQNDYGYLSVAEDPSRRLSSRAYTALSLKTGVCGAYAEAYKLLGDTVNLPVRVVAGEARGVNGWSGHAWNQVRIDGDWYHIDVTFDDPVGANVLRHNYFHVTDSDIEIDHRWDRVGVPPCTATSANWFVRNGLLVSNLKEFEHSLETLFRERGDTVTLRVQPFEENVFNEALIRRMMQESGVVARYTQSLDRVMGVIRLSNVEYHDAVAGFQ